MLNPNTRTGAATAVADYRSSTKPSWLAAAIAMAAVIGPLVYLASLAALHTLQPDVSVTADPISNFAVGKYGVLFAVATLGSGMAGLALAVTLGKGAALGWTRAGLAFLSLYAISELMAGLFPIDIGSEETMYGTVHNLVGNLSFFGFPIAAFLLSWGLGKDERWRSLRGPALALSVVVLATTVLTIFGPGIGIDYGVGQRLTNIATMGWIVFIAIRLTLAPRAG